MKKFAIFMLAFVITPFAVRAQYDDMTPWQIQNIIDTQIITPDVKEVSAPVKRHMDYALNNYQEANLKRIIINMEENENKVAKRLGKQYKPYDRQINIKDKTQVDRFLRNRVNAIY